MSALGDERVVVNLNGIPVVEIGWTAPHSTGKVTDSATDQNLGRVPPRKINTPQTQTRIGSVLVERFQALVIIYRFVIATDADGIRERWREEVGFLKRNKLP